MKRHRLNSARLHLSLFLLTLVAAIAGCGSGSAPGLSGDTSVTVLAASSANDHLSAFQLAMSSLTLKTQSGTTATIPLQGAEFIHVNGTVEPIGTATVPQGIYTSATASLGGAQFVCVGLNALGLNTSTFQYGQTPASQISVTLASPITVTGEALGLSLDLLVSKSATYSTCDDPNGMPDLFSINPTFNLTPVTFAAHPSNSGNGKFTGLTGIITALGSGGSCLTVTGGDGPVWTLDCNSSTVFQGVSGASALLASMPVNLDAVTQSDGSLLATRIAVQDTNPSSLSVWSGPAIYVAASVPVLDAPAVEQYGSLFSSNNIIGGDVFNFGSAAFAISGQLTNLSSLPFAPSFNASNAVAGQTVSITTHASTLQGPLPAATVELIPQTLDGTVSAISASGTFTAYTIQLATYDLFPQLSTLTGQASVLTAPNTVIVYADSDTQPLNTTPLDVGGVFRFTGLVFNDHGTLRMDCSQIDDGVQP